VATSILIADDNCIIRRSLRSVIEQNENWRVCGEAENGAVAVDLFTKLNPDIVLLDLSMPVMNGLDAARHITAICPDTPMLMFTMHSCEQVLKLAEPVGIRNVLSKAEGFPGNLLASLETILEEARAG
jgi:DNA-binding NarL/FixJ family response regulator